MSKLMSLASNTYIMRDHGGVWATIKWIGELPDFVERGCSYLYNASRGEVLYALHRPGDSSIGISGTSGTYVRAEIEHRRSEDGTMSPVRLHASNGFDTDKPVPSIQAASWPFPTAKTQTKIAASDISRGDFVTESQGQVMRATMLAEDTAICTRRHVPSTYVAPLDIPCPCCKGWIYPQELADGACSHCRSEHDSIASLGCSAEATENLYKIVQRRSVRECERTLVLS